MAQSKPAAPPPRTTASNLCVKSCVPEAATVLLRLTQFALDALGGFLQLTPEGVQLFGDLAQLFPGNLARLGGFSVRLARGGSDFDCHFRQFTFSGHSILLVRR